MKLTEYELRRVCAEYGVQLVIEKGERSARNFIFRTETALCGLVTGLHAANVWVAGMEVGYRLALMAENGKAATLPPPLSL